MSSFYRPTKGHGFGFNSTVIDFFFLEMLRITFFFSDKNNDILSKFLVKRPGRLIVDNAHTFRLLSRDLGPTREKSDSNPLKTLEDSFNEA